MGNRVVEAHVKGRAEIVAHRVISSRITLPSGQLFQEFERCLDLSQVRARSIPNNIYARSRIALSNRKRRSFARSVPQGQYAYRVS